MTAAGSDGGWKLPAAPAPAAAAAWGAALAGLAVALGAFGSHYLGDLLEPRGLSTFETGVRYQMFHALGLLACGALAATRAAPWFLAGTVLFSGSLYLLVLSGSGWWGAVAPLGGLVLIAGWGVLCVELIGRMRRQSGE